MIKLILCLPIIFIDIVLSGYGMIVSLLLWNEKYIPGTNDDKSMFSLTEKYFSEDGFRF